jgi:hypothetical protein
MDILFIPCGFLDILCMPCGFHGYPVYVLLFSWISCLCPVIFMDILFMPCCFHGYPVYVLSRKPQGLSRISMKTTGYKQDIHENHRT